MIETMSINQLYDYLVANTKYEYQVYFEEFTKTWKIRVLGLKPRDKIIVYIGKFSKNDKTYISLGFTKNLSGQTVPCKTLDEVLKYINVADRYFGYKIPERKPEQVSLF